MSHKYDLSRINTWTNQQNFLNSGTQVCIGANTSNYFSVSVSGAGRACFDAFGSDCSFSFCDCVCLYNAGGCYLSMTPSCGQLALGSNFYATTKFIDFFKSCGGSDATVGDVLTYNTVPNAGWYPQTPSSGIPDAPSDNMLYGRCNASWSVVPLVAGYSGDLKDSTTTTIASVSNGLITGVCF